MKPIGDLRVYPAEIGGRKVHVETEAAGQHPARDYLERWLQGHFLIV